MEQDHLANSHSAQTLLEAIKQVFSEKDFYFSGLYGTNGMSGNRKH